MTNIPSAYNYSDIAEQYEIGTINKQDIIEKLSGKINIHYVLYFYCDDYILIYNIFF